jgi:SAM-dependent methyltransferase
MSEAPTVRAVAESYAATAEHYAGIWSPVIRPVGRRLLEGLPLDRAGRVLDVGTGVGALIGDILRLAPSAMVVGVDVSDVMLGVARRTMQVPLAAMDVQRLALAGAVFDVAAMLFMLFHVPEPVVALRETARVVRPGGTVGLVTWGDDPPFEAGRIFEDELEAAGAGPDPLPLVATHELMNSTEKMEALLADAGLEPQRIWIEPHEHRWDPNAFKTYLGYGARQRRIETLESPAREDVTRRVHDRLDRLEPAGWLYRYTCVLSVARRP